MGMKKSMASFCLLFAFAFIAIPSYGQEPFTADEPCSDALVLSLKGKYREETSDSVDYFSQSLSAADVTQLKNRLKVIQQLVEETIPPAGLEPFWKLTGGNYRFAHDSQNDNGFPILRASYTNMIQYYFCWGDNSNDVPYSGETGTTLNIAFNTISSMRQSSAENFLVDGRPVYQRDPVVGKWKGYDLYASCESEECRKRSVLLHRSGISPYLPVTRKQYLEFCSALHQKFYDEMIEWFEVNETEKLEGAIKDKEEITNKYGEELEQAAKDSLLDAPAIVRDFCTVLADQPVFSTAEEGGGELVTENPAYFRKDLPTYVPQYIWVQWSWNDSVAPRRFRKVFEEDFPIEKLQALIDK
jgi:hypothetical protein